MLTYKANHVDDGISITSPDGSTFGWDEEFLSEIQSYFKRKISMLSYKSPNPENPDLMSVDVASILIISDATLQKLEDLLKTKLDKCRFRANLIISLDEKSFNESNWIGQRLLIGNVELQNEHFCERCSIITIDPETLEKDTSLLKKIKDEMNLHFGVYASVRKTGQIHIGEKVYLVD